MGRVKKMLLVLLLIVICTITKVNASGNYYTNDNGISFGEAEYNVLTTMYGDNYVINMTKEQHERIASLNLDYENTVTNVYVEPSNNIIDLNPGAAAPKGTFYATGSKQISISKNCSTTNCTIVVVAYWYGIPNIKSYDVIGARYAGTTYRYGANIVSWAETETTTNYAANTRKMTNGHGASVKLPSTGSTYYITQNYSVAGDGAIFATYQHAKSNVTLATSKLYNISSIGYGGVLDFYGAADGKYDQMQGVQIYVNI